MPQGASSAYRFRADYDGVQFWSTQANGCTLPGCTSATVTLPGGTGQTTTTIDYTYDPLYRLTSADYSTGDSYHYAYDAVGNRLTQDSSVHGLSSSVSYNYDIANRLTNVDGAPYVYDANGNLLNDGQNEYVYDSANRLTSVNGTTNYSYNGLGDRLTQNNTHYTLDLNAGLTQVLSDGTNSYTYGNGRISQTNTSTEYFLGDALGSVRQLTAGNGDITLAKSYAPYGEDLYSTGSGESAFAFTGEQTDPYIKLINLRSRMYSPETGRFTTKDSWDGDVNRPLSMNRWNYTQSNPINYTDPNGHDIFPPGEAGQIIVWCFGIAFVIPDIGPTEGICALIAAGLITAVAITGAVTLPDALEQIITDCDTNFIEKLYHNVAPEPEPTPKPLPTLPPYYPLPTPTPDSWVWVGYHGTSSVNAPSIIGIGAVAATTDVATSNFGGWQLGSGFYTTISKDAALFFAVQSTRRVGGTPMVLNVYGRGNALIPPVPVPQKNWWKIELSSPFMGPPSLSAPVDGFSNWPQIKFNAVAFPNLKVTY